jgi:hypothetical protein
MFAKKLVVFVVALVFAGAGLWAQDSGQGDGSGTVFQRYPSALGAFGNIMTSGGLTYQRWFGKSGFEATLGGIADPSGSFDYNVQGAFQYLLFGEDFADWFSGALYTNVLLAHRGTGSFSSESPSYSPYLHLGLGVGMELVFLRHLSTSIEFMYVGRYPLALEFGFGGSLKYRF